MRKGMTTVLVAMLAIGAFGFIPNLASADVTNVERLTVRTRGLFTQWGDTPIFGFLNAHVVMTDVNGTYREWARVHAIWSYERPKLNCTEPPTENFSLTFYAARLVDSTEIELNYSGYDLYIVGLWNVTEIVANVYVDENGQLLYVERTCTPMLTNATGELRLFVTLNPMPRMVFELEIEGIDLLSGFITVFGLHYFELKVCDLNDDGKVDLIDLVRIAKRWRMVPGMPYMLEMDFNFDLEINIGDLVTLASNIQP